MIYIYICIHIYIYIIYIIYAYIYIWGGMGMTSSFFEWPLIPASPHRSFVSDNFGLFVSWCDPLGLFLVSQANPRRRPQRFWGSSSILTWSVSFGRPRFFEVLSSGFRLGYLFFQSFWGSFFLENLLWNPGKTAVLWEERMLKRMDTESTPREMDMSWFSLVGLKGNRLPWNFGPPAGGPGHGYRPAGGEQQSQALEPHCHQGGQIALVGRTKWSPCLGYILFCLCRGAGLPFPLLFFEFGLFLSSFFFWGGEGSGEAVKMNGPCFRGSFFWGVEGEAAKNMGPVFCGPFFCYHTFLGSGRRHHTWVPCFSCQFLGELSGSHFCYHVSCFCQKAVELGFRFRPRELFADIEVGFWSSTNKKGEEPWLDFFAWFSQSSKSKKGLGNHNSIWRFRIPKCLIFFGLWTQTPTQLDNGDHTQVGPQARPISAARVRSAVDRRIHRPGLCSVLRAAPLGAGAVGGLWRVVRQMGNEGMNPNFGPLKGTHQLDGLKKGSFHF